MTIHEYFGHLSKEKLGKLRVEGCPQCQHMTLQFETYGGTWVCLTCGAELQLTLTVKKRKAQDLHLKETRIEDGE